MRFEVVCPYDDSMKSLECDHWDALFSVGPIKMRGKNRKTATKAKLSFVRPGVGVLHAERREFENAQIPGFFF